MSIVGSNYDSSGESEEDKKTNGKVKFRLSKTKKRKFAHDLLKDKSDATVHRNLDHTVNNPDTNKGNLCKFSTSRLFNRSFHRRLNQ
jgi:hypothetical protein